MTKVVADISMSLDGFVTGPDPDLERGLADGLRIHLAPIVLGSGTPVFTGGETV